MEEQKKKRDRFKPKASNYGYNWRRFETPIYSLPPIEYTGGKTQKVEIVMWKPREFVEVYDSVWEASRLTGYNEHKIRWTFDPQNKKHPFILDKGNGDWCYVARIDSVDDLCDLIDSKGVKGMKPMSEWV